MMHSEAREPAEAHGWLAVVAWSLLIFATIPVADTIRTIVSETFGRDVFLYGVAAVCVAAAAATIRVLVSLRRLSFARLAVIVTVYATFVVATFSLRANPEEAVHFVEYGVLGALAYRTFGRACADATVPFSAFALSASVALLDEGLQWLMPGRYWELRDVGLNLAAVALVQVAFAFGLAPESVRRFPGVRSVRSLLRWTSAAVVLLLLSMLNTPQRIAWYTAKIPALGFLVDSESAMFEYGYYYADRDTGSFKSRLSPKQLAESDRLRGEEVAAILDRYRDPDRYSEFLRRYSPVRDPFAHEVRVHLYRRDRYIERAAAYPEGSDEHRYRITVAYSEHEILQKYFPNTLRHSSYGLTDAEVAYLRDHLLPDARYESAVARSESAVSRNLVTAFNERWLVGTFVLAVLALIVVDRRISRRLGTGEHA
jgi:VanZ family protein